MLSLLRLLPGARKRLPSFGHTDPSIAGVHLPFRYGRRPTGRRLTNKCVDQLKYR